MAENDATTPPKPPTLTWLYTCNATLGTPINVGAGPKGQRTVIPITGGTFAGPKISGMAHRIPAIVDFGCRYRAQLLVRTCTGLGSGRASR